MGYYYEGTVTRSEALEILALHSFESDTPMGWYPGIPNALVLPMPVPDSTFDHEVGIRDSYTVREIKHWLGY